jgi:hypothetical protein
MGQGQSITSDFASVFQSLERMEFAKELQRNPSQYNSYVNTRIDQMSGEVFNRKRAAFQKAHIDLGRYMDMDHNANYYKARAGDVDRLTDVIERNNKTLLEGVEHDKTLSKRQFEINDWYNYNKLETLFFLQVFFMAALSMAVVIFLQKNGTVTNAMAGLITGILVAIVALVGIYRYYYTNRIRDTRLWNRRYFPKTAAPKPPAKCDPNGNLTLDLNTILPKELTQCADKEASKFGEWQENLEKELLNYQKTGDDPAPGTASLLCGGD